MESTRIPVDIRRFPWIRKLAADYAFSFSSLAPFFAGDPTASSSWTSAIARAQQYPHDRAAIANIIRSQQSQRRAPQRACDAADKLTSSASVAIVTGQQAGLFGGPAYSLYKALTAVKLAERVEREYGVAVVPVFWVEAEDHDWDEVSRSSALDAEFHRGTVQVSPPPGAGHTPIAALKFDERVSAALDELANILPPTEFTPTLLEELRKAYQPGRGVADAFSRYLEALLGARGLVVFDCSDPAAKPLAANIFLREVQHPGRTWQLAGEAGERLVANGYHAQVTTPAQDGMALFHLDGGRRAVSHTNIATVEEEVRAHPASFSPNVLLRPIVQDTLFPTICYVSGPNELAYLAQAKRVYEHFGVPMPLLFPRFSATVLDAAGMRFLAKHDVALEDLHARDEATLNRLLAAALPASVDQALQEADRAVAGSMAAVIEAVPAIDPTLEGAVKSTIGKLQHDLSTLRGKVISAAKKRDETLRRQFFRVQSQAFPDGMPQERAIGGVSLLNRHGPALFDAIGELPFDLGRHWVLTV